MNWKKQGQGQRKNEPYADHGLWMAICCGVPLALIVGLSLLGVLGAWGLYGLILLCPIAHYFLMRRMDPRNRSGTGGKIKKME